VGWVAAGGAAALAVLVLTWWPDPDGISVRLVLASAILFGFVVAVVARLATELADNVTGSIDVEIERTVDDRSWS
jgi:ascorbate-specific PTS system EIIC-type component UlaA